MFLGTHINGVDVKGRVSAPADFRAVARDEALEGVYCWPAFDGPFLEGCGQGLMERFKAMLDAWDPYDEIRTAFARAVLGEARLLGFDATGRVTLPKEFAAHAGLDGQAAFVGLGDKFQIWNPDAHEAHRVAARETLKDNKHRLRPPQAAARGDGGAA